MKESSEPQFDDYDILDEVITDIDGNFALNVKPGATIVVSFIVYVSQEIKITDQTTVNITLKEDSEMLDEVVVVGYGTMKKSDLSRSEKTTAVTNALRTPRWIRSQHHVLRLAHLRYFFL